MTGGAGAYDRPVIGDWNTFFAAQAGASFTTLSPGTSTESLEK